MKNAMYHLTVKNIGRGTSCYLKSAIRGAAYRAGELLTCESTGASWDYRDKEVYFTEIISSHSRAFWTYDRQSLWNAVECANPRKNACFAKEIELALPAGLSHDAKIELTRRFITDEIVEKYGVVADCGYHNFEGAGSHNPHCHIMFTIRSVTDEGFGKRVPELVQRKFVFDIRKAWSDHANPVLRAAGLPTIDERSCLRQGRQRRSVPMGEKAYKLEHEMQIKTAPGDEHRLAEKGLKTKRQLAWERERAREYNRERRI